MILHSKIYGETIGGIPLLVFHGLFGMLDNWGTFGKELGVLLPVHLMDLRNHGRSFHSPDMSHDDLARDIYNYMEHHGIEKAHLLGHSLGGKAVMQFAVQNTHMVEKLVVVDIAPKAYPPHHQAVIKALQSVDFSQVKSRQEVEEVLIRYIDDRAVIQFLTKNLYWTEDKSLNWRFNLKVLADKYSDFVGNPVKYGVFPGETLFIGGAKSHYILPQDEFLIKQQFPKANIIKVEHAGHWVQAENPKAFNEAVRKFII